MDYQASARSCKIAHPRNKRTATFFLSILISLLIISPWQSLAQVAPNPLTENITISAQVLEKYLTPPPSQGPGSVVSPIGAQDAALFKGLAYPRGVVSLLKNGIVIAETEALSDGTFEIHVQNLPGGTYSFGIRGQDSERRKSNLLMFSIFVSPTVTTVVSGIFIPPTITSDKVEVKRGELITFFGASAPDALVRLSLSSDVEFLKKTTSNAKGVWTFTMNSSELSPGDYISRARSITTKDLSPYGDDLPFKVGTVDRLRSKGTALLGFRKKCDLNVDDRVNLLDFSIMAFYWTG